jgi:DNA-binding transcriptional MerR regulator
MAYTVKFVAEASGISIRTLHHYDAISLLKPAQVSASNYRLYSEADLQKLQQILFFRELGFSLKQIKDIVDSPDFDRRQALLHHKNALLMRLERIRRLIQTIDRTLDSEERTIAVTEQEMFDGFDPTQYEEEGESLWGNRPAWKESQQRTRRYSKQDWKDIQAEAKMIAEAIASRMDLAPGDPEVQEWIAQYHQHINDRYYTCTTRIFRGLADSYVQDERFTASWERVKPGMAQFMNAAMIMYCNMLIHQAELG